MKCWICQINEANSEKHKFKASDIRRQFGKSFAAKDVITVSASLGAKAVGSILTQKYYTKTG